jgi:RNA polymerase-binding protein DksA
MALTAQQTSELRGIIERRRQTLLVEIRRDVARWREEHFGELAGPVPDAGDESVAALIEDLDQADLTRDVDELRGLEAAQSRIAAGSYGVCIECGNEIAFERLRAEPGAIRCIDCQRLYEKTHVSPTGSKL